LAHPSGWKVLAARKSVVVICGLGMTSIMGAAFISNFSLMIALFAISTFAYAAWSTMALALRLTFIQVAVWRQ